MNQSRYGDRLIEIISAMSAKQQKQLLDELEGRKFKKVRKHPRKECILIVHFASKGHAHQNITRDISADGVFIETTEPFSVGDKIFLTLSYSNAPRPFKVEGEVARIETDGIGIKFKRVSPVQKQLINLIIEKSARLI